MLAFGCSHTYGVGVAVDETWPYYLRAMNFGVPGCSSDLIIRTMPAILDRYTPKVVFILWPDWTRFEIGTIQSLPTDKNRIHYMKDHDESWLKNNFKQRVAQANAICENKGIKLVDMTLSDLIPYIDYPDKWPLSKLGHHFNNIWHNQVATIFNNALLYNIKHPLSNE